MREHADLKAWCHWKRLEKGLSEDDALFVKAVEDAISQAGMVATLRTQLKQAIEERDSALEKLATTSKGSLSVEAMLAKLAMARFALGYYADKNEWIDYKATGVAAGRLVQVDSHFDGDLGQLARDALVRIKG